MFKSPFYRKHRPTIEKATKQSSYGGGGDGGIGTEAAAQQCIDWNAKEFGYPNNGFFSRIEHSLLYAMLRSPNIFPADVVVKAIEDDMENEDDDWTVYLYARPERGQTTTSGNTNVSYAQLSATLALAGESWDPKSRVPEVLHKRILKCVLRHADRRGLDRKSEVQDLLKPLVDRSKRAQRHANMAIIVPLYVGWAASLITLNPIPLAVAYGVVNVSAIKMSDDRFNERKNFYEMQKVGQRASNMEQAGLLEEAEDTTVDMGEEEDGAVY